MNLEDDYVSKMEASLPLWVQFNEHKRQLADWLLGAEEVYSNNLYSGDPDLTERSLRNAEVGN